MSLAGRDEFEEARSNLKEAVQLFFEAAIVRDATTLRSEIFITRLEVAVGRLRRFPAAKSVNSSNSTASSKFRQRGSHVIMQRRRETRRIRCPCNALRSSRSARSQHHPPVRPVPVFVREN